MPDLFTFGREGHGFPDPIELKDCCQYRLFVGSTAESRAGLFSFRTPSTPYDALLLVSFGGPEKQEDVIPFLQNVLRDKRVPAERFKEVASHYEYIGGASPINQQNRALLAALVAELNVHGPRLPVFRGNRNWHPLLPDTLKEMAEEGVQHAPSLSSHPRSPRTRDAASTWKTSSGHKARWGRPLPHVDKLRLFDNHPGFIESMAKRIAAALASIPAKRRDAAAIVYTAHSVPLVMAAASAYVGPIERSVPIGLRAIARSEWTLAYRSRHGPPDQPWLNPTSAITSSSSTDRGQLGNLVLVPIGFLSEHMEVVYDLDVEIAALCEHLGIHLVRAQVVGTHPRLVRMIRELVVERLDPAVPRLALGTRGPSPDVCPVDCCRVVRPG